MTPYIGDPQEPPMVPQEDPRQVARLNKGLAFFERMVAVHAPDWNPGDMEKAKHHLANMNQAVERLHNADREEE